MQIILFKSQRFGLPLINSSKNFEKNENAKKDILLPPSRRRGQGLIKKFRKIVKFDKIFVIFTQFPILYQTFKISNKFKKLNDKKWKKFWPIQGDRDIASFQGDLFAFLFAFYMKFYVKTYAHGKYTWDLHMKSKSRKRLHMGFAH